MKRFGEGYGLVRALARTIGVPVREVMAAHPLRDYDRVVDLMWAIPVGMFFFAAFFVVRFLVAMTWVSCASG